VLVNRSTPILHVEDDPVDVGNLRRAFSRCGIPNPLCAVSSVAEALALLRARSAEPGPRPGLILLDLSMPDRGGLELLRDLKSDPDLRAIPVIVVTASQHARDRRDAYALGAAGYVVKPIEFESFVRAVQTVERYWALCESP
jgi:CheY-like chemotaxis protein